MQSYGSYMPKSRIGAWLAPVIIVVVVLLLAIPGLFVYMNITAKPLHPNAQKVPSVAQSAPLPEWTEAVEHGRQLVRARLAERNLPGLSVAVGSGGSIVWTEGFGFADLEKRVPVTPKHRFRIGTASTVLTSAAMGLLLEKGRFSLDDPIQTYVPAFPQKQWPVTLRQLMGHVAGVATDSGDEGPLFGEHCEQPVEALRQFAQKPLLFEPGTEFRFSSYGWILLSAAIQAVAEESFLNFMHENVFAPLGMTDTLADSLTTPIPDRVIPYFPRFAADPTYGPDPMRDVDYSCYAGASVFLSTPSDLLRFGMALDSGKLLQRKTVDLLRTSLRLPSGKDTGYGLGWDLDTVTIAGEPTYAAGHNGNVLGGLAASFWTFPEHGIVVAVISNISYADTFSLATKIAQTFVEYGAQSRPKK